jgi:DeoR/GlpR family transcriptional regulator of sugar metabolism
MLPTKALSCNIILLIIVNAVFYLMTILIIWEKESIADLAASLVQEGDVIGLTGGTTTYLIAKALKKRRNLTIVTNAVNIAMERFTAEGAGKMVYLPG